MTKVGIVPPAQRAAAEQMRTSAAVVAGGFVFLTGMTGSDADGGMPADARTQFRNAFEKIATILAEAGLTFAAVVEMTSYHIGIADHFDLFSAVRADYVTAPYPAWTAVEVAGLRRPGAIVEIRVVAVDDRQISPGPVPSNRDCR